MDFQRRVEAHHALGDAHRLAVVDALRDTDLTFSELGECLAIEANLLAHHLGVLERAGLVTRRVSEGDRRRRYVALNGPQLDALAGAATFTPERVLFVCTHNSARSQFAAAFWELSSGSPAQSAGHQPARRVHPTAARIAGEFGVDLSDRTPQGYDAVRGSHDTVVSVCDRAREAGIPPATRSLHWSIPDPVAQGADAAFRDAFDRLSRRIERLLVSRQPD